MSMADWEYEATKTCPDCGCYECDRGPVYCCNCDELLYDHACPEYVDYCDEECRKEYKFKTQQPPCDCGQGDDKCQATTHWWE